MNEPVMNEPGVSARRHRFEGGKMFGGLILISFGILFLLDRLNVADFGQVMRHWWPLFPIAIGVTKLWCRKTFWSGAWLVAVGIWLMFASHGWFGLDYGNSWPLLLIVLGGGIIARSLFEAVSGRRTDEPRA